jgi:quaternary ammonium compound-resistance protein SugE
MLIFVALCYAAGGVCMKWSAGLTRPWPSVGVFTLFCAGAALQCLAMRDAEMGSTYIVVLGLEASLAFGLGVRLFAEPFTGVRMLAVLLVIAGMVLLKR